MLLKLYILCALCVSPSPLGWFISLIFFFFNEHNTEIQIFRLGSKNPELNSKMKHHNNKNKKYFQQFKVFHAVPTQNIVPIQPEFGKLAQTGKINLQLVATYFFFFFFAKLQDFLQ